MKDAKGHGSNGRYAAATGAVAASHQAGVEAATQRPTAAQFASYRAGRREAVTRIARVVKSGTIPRSTWARGAVLRARADHSASIKRQFGG